MKQLLSIVLAGWIRLFRRRDLVPLANMLTDAAVDAMLKHYYQNLAHPNIGDATGLPASATAGSFWISLHTADPGAGGNQTTNEATYTGYARIPIVRSASGFTVASGVVSNAALAAFAACTGGSNYDHPFRHWNARAARATFRIAVFSDRISGRS
jgi:hypothetical protein